LDPTSSPFKKALEDFGGDEDLYVSALIQFLSQREFLTKPNAPYPGYTNFDHTSLMFTYISTPQELDYQIDILRFILRQKITNKSKAIYGHFLDELTRVRSQYLKKREGWFFAQHEIWWGNRWEREGWMEHRTGVRKHPTQWTAEINNYSGQASAYRTYQAFEGIVVAVGSGIGGGNRSAPGVLPYVQQPGRKSVTNHYPLYPRWRVDQSMVKADKAAGVIINGSYIRNPTARSISGLLTQSGKIGGKKMSGQFMYVIDASGNIVIGSRAGQRMPHPTLIGGESPSVIGAGIVDIRGGRIYSVDNASGHYKPGPRSLDAAREYFGRLPQGAFHPNFQGYLPFNQ